MSEIYPGAISIFLDDVRVPLDAFNYTKDMEYLQDKWIIVRNYEEFITYTLEYFKEHKQLPEMFSFDRDLSDKQMENPDAPASELKEKSGEDCATWLMYFCVDNDLEMPKWKIHSQNPIAFKTIPFILTNDYEKLMSFKNNP